jgi:hypothetical protein
MATLPSLQIVDEILTVSQIGIVRIVAVLASAYNSLKQTRDSAGFPRVGGMAG